MPRPQYNRWLCEVVMPTDLTTVIWTYSAAQQCDIDAAWKKQFPSNPGFINMVKLNRAAAGKIPNSLIRS